MNGTQRPLCAIVLAAGQGTRMRSTRPKPLHLLCGRPMIRYVLDSLVEVAPSPVVVVVGHHADRLTGKLTEDPDEVAVTFAVQEEQLGTGDAVASGLRALDPGDEGDVIVVPGDAPLLRPGTLTRLVTTHRGRGAAATLLTARLDDPSGYGRIIRAPDGQVLEVVEDADATAEQRAVTEVNTSIYCFRRPLLAEALAQVGTDNAQGEMYLPDVIRLLSSTGHAIAVHTVEDAAEARGVNDRVQLAGAEAILRARINEAWMRAGVTMVDPAATYVDRSVELDTDVTLFPGTVLKGATVVGARSVLGPEAHLVDTVVAEGAVVERSTAYASTIGARARVGPYVTLEVGSVVAPDAQVGPRPGRRGDPSD